MTRIDLFDKQIIVHSDVDTYPSHLSESEGLRLNDLIHNDRMLMNVPRHLHNKINNIVSYDKNKCKVMGL